jgi:hypothetical protein
MSWCLVARFLKHSLLWRTVGELVGVCDSAVTDWCHPGTRLHDGPCSEPLNTGSHAVLFVLNLLDQSSGQWPVAVLKPEAGQHGQHAVRRHGTFLGPARRHTRGRPAACSAGYCTSVLPMQQALEHMKLELLYKSRPCQARETSGIWCTEHLDVDCT